MHAVLPSSIRRFVSLPLAFATALAFVSAASASINLTTFGSAYTQDFDTLANSETSTAVPTDWVFAESFPNANGVYVAGTGSSNAGDTYSFGAAASMERAFGMLRSSTLLSTIGASFANSTGGTIDSLLIGYTGEQWRLGERARNDRMDFQYSLDAVSLSTGTWLDFDLLDFTAPQGTTSPIPTPGALNGNAAANRTAISNTIAALSIASGSTFWIRWSDFNAAGSDDGLGLDDFSLTASGTLPPTAGTLPEASALLVWLALWGSVLVVCKRCRPTS